MHRFWPLIIYETCTLGINKSSIVSGWHHWHDEPHVLVELYDEQVHQHFFLVYYSSCKLPLGECVRVNWELQCSLLRRAKLRPHKKSIVWTSDCGE